MSSIGNPYVPEVEKFVNSKEFSYLATIFEQTGFYTHLREGSDEYIAFWKDVRHKCLYGFTNSKGIRITGNYFFYLNFQTFQHFNDFVKFSIKLIELF